MAGISQAYAQHYGLDFSTFSPSPPNGMSCTASVTNTTSARMRVPVPRVRFSVVFCGAQAILICFLLFSLFWWRAGHSYMRDYYMRPWARCPPYLMGVGGAFAWIAWGGRGARRR